MGLSSFLWKLPNDVLRSVSALMADLLRWLYNHTLPPDHRQNTAAILPESTGVEDTPAGLLP
ncbi:hypothetical protein [Acaryochloris sp. IP29b_bin.148]|uniref:hypothetical protein n=1 Tax=Acaryochloris sp. IP29b_bin.148 TaxID=2969218 RepID=UPI00263315CD|nr:hypothetical protein [Acaryochloris sp. IP29b_bin.148]